MTINNGGFFRSSLLFIFEHLITFQSSALMPKKTKENIAKYYSKSRFLRLLASQFKAIFCQKMKFLLDLLAKYIIIRIMLAVLTS